MRLRVASMDCAVEEAEIRRVVAGIAGVRSISINLGQRTVTLDAPAPAIELALKAMRQCGFDPQPLAETLAPAASAVAAPDGLHDDHDHAPGGGRLMRLGLALGLAIAAEALAFLAPDAPAWQGFGLAVAAAAIWAAGFDVYKKGLIALGRPSRCCGTGDASWHREGL